MAKKEALGSKSRHTVARAISHAMSLLDGDMTTPAQSEFNALRTEG